MLVTIEGVVNSDVCAEGASHTVEWTRHLRGLVRSGLVKVTNWNPTPPADPEPEPSPEPEPEPVKPAPRSRASRRRASEAE